MKPRKYVNCHANIIYQFGVTIRIMDNSIVIKYGDLLYALQNQEGGILKNTILWDNYKHFNRSRIVLIGTVESFYKCIISIERLNKV